MSKGRRVIVSRATLPGVAGQQLAADDLESDCRNCDMLMANGTDGRCTPCRRYFNRTGRERPQELIDRQRARLARLDPKDVERRFASHIVKSATGCWVWTGARDGNGYGHFMLGRTRLAHRLSYEMFVGPIPPGLILDHLCGVKWCVRPSHLEPVTQQENARRAVHRAGIRRGATRLLDALGALGA